MNRSIQEYLRCIINGNDTRYTEWSTDVKLFALSYNSQITTENVYNFSIKQVNQYDKEQNKQHLFMSDREFRPILKFFRATFSSIKNMKDSNSDMISLHIYNNSLYKKPYL